MIELKRDRLTFTFPDVHPQAKLTIEFQRTLRIPDDDKSYPLPPGLGTFPLRHVDDHAQNIPSDWLRRGGVMLPMYQSEAMWLRFDSTAIDQHSTEYPFAIKIATGKRCAVSGESWRDGLHKEPQDYMVAPKQPWLDGFVVQKGVIRQFVAMPLGSGYTVEEQITGEAEHGGLQVSVCPMKRDVFERRFPKQSGRRFSLEADFVEATYCCAAAFDMGLAPGGKMKQEVYEDPYDLDDWHVGSSSRCFVHLCNSMVWQSITGSSPPHPAPTAKSYTSAGLPWFEYYDDSQSVVEGSAILHKLKSVAQQSRAKKGFVLPENDSVTPENVKEYRKGLRAGQVREETF
jgi:hypothetical protein